MFIEDERQDEELAQVSVSNVVRREKTLAGIALAIVVVFMECILYGSRCWLNDYYWGKFFNDWAIRHILLVFMLIAAIIIPFEFLSSKFQTKLQAGYESLHKKLRIAWLTPHVMSITTLVVAGFVVPVAFLYMYIEHLYWYIHLSDNMIVWLSVIWVIMVLNKLMEIVDNPRVLLFISLALMTATGYWSLFLYGGYFYSILLTASLNISWNIWYIRSDHEHKKRTVIENFVANLLILFAFGTFYDSFVSVDRWFNPQIYGQTDFIRLQDAHSLKLLRMDYKYAYMHPFSSIYTVFSGRMLVMFILAFLLVSAIVVHAGKLISKKRYNIMLAIYMGWVVLFIANLLGDLGFVPSILRAPFTYEPSLYELIIMLRLLMVKKVAEKKTSMEEEKNGNLFYK